MLGSNPSNQADRGISIVSVLVGLAISGILTLIVISVSEISLKQQNQSNVTFQIDQLRRNFQNALNNTVAWRRTVAASDNSPPYTHNGPDFGAPPGNNAGLNCLVGAGSNCTDAVNNPITNAPINQIRDANGAIVMDLLANNGFTLQGIPCNSFVAPPASGSELCPLTFRVTWTAICGVNCAGPNVTPNISIVPIYNPPAGSFHKINFNPANYSASFRQGGATDCWVYDGTNLIDTCPGNVGIGTTNPLHPLQIEGVAGVDVDNRIVLRLTDLTSAAAGTGAGISFGGWVNGTGNHATFGGIKGIKENNNPGDARGSLVFTTRNSITGPAEKMRINGDGNVGIGTNNPQQRLDVSGNVQAQAFLYVSDKRLKERIATLEGASLARSLRGVSFVWSQTGARDIGFVAQEVERIAPELVVTAENGLKTVKYANIAAILVEAFKASELEQNRQAETILHLLATIAELEHRVQELELRLETHFARTAGTK